MCIYWPTGPKLQHRETKVINVHSLTNGPKSTFNTQKQVVRCLFSNQRAQNYIQRWEKKKKKKKGVRSPFNT